MKTEKLSIGILAHVDAGKTTLSESILYCSGSIRKLGRVDHGDAFFDTDRLERARGITIFSKQARFSLKGRDATLLDTPGHVDFSSEMERTLRVMDYGILVINGADGVQSHTLTLWKLLGCYGIPVFLFINKMDQPGTERQKLLSDLQRRLDERCVDFSTKPQEDRWESLAVCDETLLSEYLDCGTISDSAIAEAVVARTVFPCYFGSALRMVGVEELLTGLSKYCQNREYPDSFAARVFKITRDSQGNRLTHMKITGGALRVKDALSLADRAKDTEEKTGGKSEGKTEKVDQIRFYSGDSFQTSAQAEAGTICAVTGLEHTWAGQGLGGEAAFSGPVLEPVLTYRILLPTGADPHVMLSKLRQLEEEEPQLHLSWNESLGEIHAQVMGEIEIEILKSLIAERFGTSVEFDSGSILYRETIEEPVEGVGHFEPLRHYAEVHLLLEPGEPGSGLVLESRCSEDMLDRNWQRLILTHLAERNHPGVLTGAEITDMRITLLAGKAHVKHTEGGDFRHATYRAVRQGLKKGKCVLLEPIYDFQLEVPTENVGRALADIQRMCGSFQPPVPDGEMSIISGWAPVSEMQSYQTEVAVYTKGRGRLFCTFRGYEPCHNSADVIAAAGYDSEQDVDNPTGSVFCSHGAGFLVSWDQVEQHMHVDSGWRPEKSENDAAGEQGRTAGGSIQGSVDEAELEEIFLRTYGPIKRERNRFQTRRQTSAQTEPGETAAIRSRNRALGSRERYLLVDGYNIIFAWDDLKELAAASLDGAREKLIDILNNYQGFRKITVILVFDAYRVEGGRESVEKDGEIYVIYTKEAETADQYIEKAVRRLERDHDITVATSDGLIQTIIWGEGAWRLSAQELREEIESANREIRNTYARYGKNSRNYPFQKEEISELMEKSEQSEQPDHS